MTVALEGVFSCVICRFVITSCGVVCACQGDALAAPGGAVNAKLFVTCTSKPEVPPWVFYLRGVVG